MISDRLHLSIEKAICTRIDIAQNMIAVYIILTWDNYNITTDFEQDNGLYYNNYQKQLVFYGKIQEQKKRK